MPRTVDDSDDQLVIALDFGTTYSGMAFAFAGKPEVYAITGWPELEGYSQPKVPTTICYDAEDPEKFTWGGEEHSGEVFHGIKLLLDPDQKMPEYLPKSLVGEDLKRIGKSPVDVAADYISAIYNHALKIIKSKVPANYFKICEKVFVLTVPAVWSDKARDLTLQAAKQADIYPLILIKEPEAAAVYTLNSLRDKGLKVGESFILCDAGGGTVDLISYEITRLSPRLELKEVVPSTGSMAGNDEFHRLRKTEAFKIAMNEFDKQQKPRFRGASGPPGYINFLRSRLQDIPGRGLVDNCWQITGNDMKAIFDPLIMDIVRLVDAQVAAIVLKRLRAKGKKIPETKSQNHNFVKTIVLVGGFGSSAYLASVLEKANEGIQIIQPVDAWASIVKEAVLSNLAKEARTMSWLAPRHYGTKASAVFEEELDKGRNTWTCPHTGKLKCTKMTWYIRSGEELQRDQRITFGFNRFLLQDHHPVARLFTERLYHYDAEDAPRHPSPNMKLNCKFTADLRMVPKKHFTKHKGHDGNKYVRIHYDIVINIQSAIMKFSLEIDGKEMGSVDVNYE